MQAWARQDEERKRLAALTACERELGDRRRNEAGA
jgi:hypothetical protein